MILRRRTPVVLLAAALLPLCAGADAPDRLVVTWDDAPAGPGRVAALEVSPPFALVTPALAVGTDGRVRAGSGRVAHLSRATGVLSWIDPSDWSVEREVALGAATEPRDVAILDAATAWVSSAALARLRRVDLVTGDVTDATDLAPLGVGGGVGSPVMETLLVHEGRLYVQLAEPETFPPEPSLLAVIDLATGALVDADPAAPGVQGILLQGTAPRFKMQVVPGTNRLLLSSTGAFHDFGGLELVDLDTLESLGVVVREWEDVGGNDLGAFAMVDSEQGWLVFSTDIVLSSHLHPFTLSEGGGILEADTSLFYFAPHLVYDPARDTLWWPEPGGVQPFDGTTGDELAPATPLPGDPTDLAFHRAPRAVPLPAWSAALLALAVGLGARRRSRGRLQP